MRTSNRLNYLQNIYNFQRMQDDVNRAQNRNIDERKFHESFDDSTSFSEAMRLDGEISELKLVRTAAEKAEHYTKNSDVALSEMSKKLDDFKVKLLQSSNQIHSQTSLSAIANDLQQIRNHILNIANTSINGQFLFSGTAINVKPFNDDGSYNGNAENMQVLLGSNVRQNYNISGQELFISRDNDYNKVVSSNMRLIDRRYDTSKPEGLHYLSEKSLIRDLVGREYLKPGARHPLDDTQNFRGEEKFPDTYFYISGTKGDGTSVRAKFAMHENESMSALFKRIGEVFGNTDSNKLVNVQLTNSGTIEITDLNNPHSRLNFSMFAATKRCTDEEIYGDKFAEIDALEDEKNQIAGDFGKPADGKKSAKAAEEGGEKALGDGGEAAEKSEKSAEIAEKSAEISDKSAKSSLRGGTAHPGGNDPANRDSVEELQKLSDAGEVFLLDFCNNARLSVGGDENGMNYAKTYFDVKDQFITSNVAQHHKSGRLATESDRLIDCCAAPINTDPAVFPHTELRVNVSSKSGKTYNLRVDLTEGCVRWEDDALPRARPQIPATALGPAMEDEWLKSQQDRQISEQPPGGGMAVTGKKSSAVGEKISAAEKTDGEKTTAEKTSTDGEKIPATVMKYPRRLDFTRPIYDPHTEQSFRRKSEPGEITFAQLGHVISMFAADCAPDHDIIADDPLPKEVGVGTRLFEGDKELLERLFDDTDGSMNARMEGGKLMFEDCSNTTTKVRIAIYDAICDGDEFAMQSGDFVRNGDVFTFATNGSVIVDEQQIDLIKDLDKMIEAVRSGQYRADGGSGAQNPGLQAAIKRLDHLYDHVNKCHTKVGAMQRAIESAADRAMIMDVNLTDIKSKIMGSRPEDKAEALMAITTTMNAFGAVLQTSAMINKISLLDYIR